MNPVADCNSSGPPKRLENGDQRLLLVLDLDETLIHATDAPTARAPDHKVFGYSVYRRPGLDAFIREAGRHFMLGVWTSSSADYAHAICSLVFPDPTALQFIWARDKCTRRRNFESQDVVYVKRLVKLRRYGYDLSRVLVIDDSPEKHPGNYGNLVRVTPFEGDPRDEELAHLASYLAVLAKEPDMRRIEKRGWWNRRRSSGAERA